MLGIRKKKKEGRGNCGTQQLEVNWEHGEGGMGPEIEYII